MNRTIAGHTTHLPTSANEVAARGWDELDVILLSGDAYVDHPSFGAAVIGRTLESAGYRVAIVPQPNWRDDLRDFRKLGRPRLFFGVSAGAMDSMVNRYTATRRLRSEDAYTPDGRADMRPDYPTIVYTRILKELFPGTPVVIGGIEASLRRLTHYDYWQDRLLPSFLIESGADILSYGMGEKAVVDIARAMHNGYNLNLIKKIPQIAYLDTTPPVVQSISDVPETGQSGVAGTPQANPPYNASETRGQGTTAEKSAGRQYPIFLHSYEQCAANKKAFAENFVKIEVESNKMEARTIVEPCGDKFVVVNPPYPIPTTEELDAIYALPFARTPHPRYRGKRIPAYEMIRHSVTAHRGCFGGCSFCTISAHQGKFVASRSAASVLSEIRAVTAMENFHGTISDIGGPSANMWGMGGKDSERCRKCARASCLFPEICLNLGNDHRPLAALYREALGVPRVKHIYIGSGIRYDLFDAVAWREYLPEVVRYHTGGRLKVAPEHTEPGVLKLMRKPSFAQFERLESEFNAICNLQALPYQIIPYFISGHPGCTPDDMGALAAKMKRLGLRLEQVQDFTPTPMTLSSAMFYTGTDPYTGAPLYTALSRDEKEAQKSQFFWHKSSPHKSTQKTVRKPGAKASVSGNKQPVHNTFRPNKKHGRKDLRRK